MGYAAGNGERMGIVLEIRQGMVDRGADISWLSQVPVHLCCTCMHEDLCAPLMPAVFCQNRGCCGAVSARE